MIYDLNSVLLGPGFVVVDERMRASGSGQSVCYTMFYLSEHINLYVLGRFALYNNNSGMQKNGVSLVYHV